MRWASLACRLLCALAAWGPATSSAARYDGTATIVLGWDGQLTVGRWNPVIAEFDSAEPGEWTLEIATPDPLGHTARYVETQSLPAGRHRFASVFQLGRLEGVVTARLFPSRDGQPAGVEVASTTLALPRREPNGLPQELSPLMLSERLFLTVGVARGFESLSLPDVEGLPRRVVGLQLESPEKLPTDPRAYDAVHTVVLAGSQPVSTAAAEALRDWVNRGGRIVVSMPDKLAAWLEHPLRSWLPISVGEEPVAVRELGRLEAYAGRNTRIPLAAGKRMSIPRLDTSHGVVLAESGGAPLLVRTPYGFGEVLILAIDITKPPLVNWSALRDLNAKLLALQVDTYKDGPSEEPRRSIAQPIPVRYGRFWTAAPVALKTAPTGNDASAAPQRTRQLTSTGITDLASQLVATQDYFLPVFRVAPSATMAYLLLYLALIGPLDFALVHYVLRKPVWTWITVTVSVVGFGLLATWSADATAPRQPLLKQLEVLDIDASQDQVLGRAWITNYAPETSRPTFSIAATPFGKEPVLSPDVNWFAAPEAAFGGLYRAPGTEWGKTTYTLETSRGLVRDFPILARSTGTIASTWFEDHASLLEARLQSTGVGRLTGSITHHLPGPVTDWILAFGNRAYRKQAQRADEFSVDWPPEEPFTLEDPLVYQRELRSVLTRTVIRVEREAGKTGSTMRQEQSRYDSLQREPHALWQTISFHAETGGSSYTGLTNHLLADAELTRHLQMGQAVLFGQVRMPPRLVVQRDGQAVTADEATVIVRMILPVQRATEIPRTLPKFEHAN